MSRETLKYLKKAGVPLAQEPQVQVLCLWSVCDMTGECAANVTAIRVRLPSESLKNFWSRPL